MLEATRRERGSGRKRHAMSSTGNWNQSLLTGSVTSSVGSYWLSINLARQAIVALFEIREDSREQVMKIDV